MSISLAAKAAEFVTLALLATVVPRALGPADYGVFSVAVAVVTFTSSATALGGPTLMARYVPEAMPGERPRVARALFRKLARRRALQLGLIAAVALVLTLAEPDRFPVSITLLVTLAIALSITASLLLQTGLGLGRTTAWSLRQPAQNVVLVGAVLILHEAFGTLGAVAAVPVAYALAALLGLATALRPLLSASPGEPVPPGALRFGAIQAIAGLLVQLRYRGVIVLVALLAGATESGFVAAAVGAALAAIYAVNQMFTVTLPERVRSAAHFDDPETASRALAWRVALVVLAVGVIGALLLDRAVPLVFGEAFGAAGDAFAPALAVVVLAPFTALAAQTAALRVRSDVALLSAVLAVGACVVVTVALVGQFGALAGTAGMFAGMLVSALTSLLRLPGAFDRRLVILSIVGAFVVLAVGLT